ncbi:MAG TPA: histidine kinase [Flavobacteriaceae bacterium]|nr:histidine kinase [Flavobacteriaceae bacterium]HAT63467.1 histidine kinase [Flavobacteriaceae bacterium]|tara:strand:+ start:551 stop:1315 length:765 start_codon:yes stop_codon:yes gene_type:complete
MDQEGIQSFLIVFSIIAFALALTVILLFAIFQKRKNKLVRIQQETENKFKEEIIETQIEIREETLRNISWELHDNIGQLLTLAKIQLNEADETCGNVSEASETISECLKELRNLSKLINPDTFSSLTLIEALKMEIQRFNRMKYLETTLEYNQETFELNTKVETIIFRMLQEFFTNTIKHSKATQLIVKLTYTEETLEIKAEDNGVGFDVSQLSRGIGLSNIKNRAKIIGAKAIIESKKGKGTQFLLTYKNKQS